MMESWLNFGEISRRKVNMGFPEDFCGEEQLQPINAKADGM